MTDKLAELFDEHAEVNRQPARAAARGRRAG